MVDAARSSDSRRIIGDLLEVEDLDDATWLARARGIRASKGLPVFTELLRLLTHLRFSEQDAEAAWRSLIEHRRALTEPLCRDPGTSENRVWKGSLRVRGRDQVSRTRS